MLQSALRWDGVLRGSAAVAQITEREGVTKEQRLDLKAAAGKAG